VGEETNKLVGYLAGVSRKLDKPLAVIIQSTSAAGKSALMDAVLAMMPDEEAVCYSAMSGQSLFYMGETNLKHKILAIAEEEGAESASYALKILQSDGQLTMASTGKDATTGKLVTQEYHVEGPVMIFLTTTAIEIDEELLNRCIVLTVNESREQTEAIHTLQRTRKTIEGLLADQDRKDIIQLHKNAQRLLRPILIANPYAEQLTFKSDKTRTRRDHMKYLTLINTITLLHQYQREIKKIKHKGKMLEYIEVTINDIEVANRLASEVRHKADNY
jgi:DNA primase